MLSLKKIDKSMHALRRAADIWQQQGHDVVLEYPIRNGVWLPLTDESRRWCGWLRLRDWLEYAAPELAGFAQPAGFNELVVEWLATVERPLVLQIAELAYNRLVFGELITGASLPQKQMLRVTGEYGSLWLEHAPELINKCDLVIPKNMSWLISFVVGYSVMRQVLLKRIFCGDILLITESIFEVRCHTKKIGVYKQSEEGLIMDLSLPLETQETQNDDVMIMRSIEQLPVKLEFVLYATQLTMKEIKELYQMKLFTLPAEVEHHVEVRSNGARLGYGELVELGGQLGVEIIEWMGESYNGK